MGRYVLGLTALLLIVINLSPARSASLMNNTIRISPAFHSISPSVQFSERPSLNDIHVTKPTDVATPKPMTRKHSVSDIHFTKYMDKSSPKLMTRKHSVKDFHFTQTVNKASP